MHQNPQGLMKYREQVVVFRKDGINHIARVITYVEFLYQPDADLKIMFAEAA